MHAHSAPVSRSVHDKATLKLLLLCSYMTIANLMPWVGITLLREIIYFFQKVHSGIILESNFFKRIADPENFIC
jgi:hypothetical protein